VERVTRSLSVLSPEQRQVVERRVWGGKTFAEIAAELDAPIGTVLTRMRLALCKLSKALHDDHA
jgi:RNA polymerase sigma-70 factor (ECF subfamily)